MLFNGFSFLLFLACSVLVLYLTPLRRRWVALLFLSIVFYASFRVPILLAVAAAEAWIAWRAGRAIEQTERLARRWHLFLAAMVGLIGTLVLVRLTAHSALLSIVGLSNAWLPSTIGVSYFSLQAVSYVVDVYLGRTHAEPSFLRVMTYLILYPKLVQGPIERAAGIFRQLEAPQIPGYDGLRSATALFGWGLFKKVVLGDRLARIVDPVFDNPSNFAGFAAAAGAYAFAFQLYFDFSGYTDMARGTARFLGIELSENFRAPYLATGIIDFWRRWHITFSRWLLDYVFAPLQVSWRAFGIAGTAAALFVTFTLSGLWHGFAWTFVIWGVLHGIFLATEVFWRDLRRQPSTGTIRSRLWATILTFHLVTIAWVFFRAQSLHIALAVLRAIPQTTRGLGHLMGPLGGQWVVVTLAACAGYALVATYRTRPLFLRLSQFTAVRWIAYTILLLSILLLRQDGAAYFYAQF